MKIKLTELQTLQIVLKWYTNGMYPDILQNENGEDLEEILAPQIYELKNKEPYKNI